MTKAAEDFEALGEELAEEISDRAAIVVATPEEYRAGLRDVLKAVRARVELDIRASEETDDTDYGEDEGPVDD